MSPQQTALAAHAEFRATLQAYDRWARSYPPAPHNPLMRVEEALMRQHWPQAQGRAALDLACGTGRYARLLSGTGAAHVTALDCSAAMLQRVTGAARVRASMMSLPFEARSMDVIVSGLAVGHAQDLAAWHREIARVLAPRGALLYSDFHPDAAQIGFKRAFEDESGQTTVVPHRVHAVAAHAAATAAAGLRVDAIVEGRLGIELQEDFPGADALYRRWHGLPLVLVVRAGK